MFPSSSTPVEATMVAEVYDDYHVLCPSSTPEQIACQLFLSIGSIVDGYTDLVKWSSEYEAEKSLSACINHLYTETFRAILKNPSSYVRTIHTMGGALSLLEDKVQASMKELKESLAAEYNGGVPLYVYPGKVAEIEALEKELAEITTLVKANPKLLEDCIIDKVEHIAQFKQRHFLCWSWRYQLPDKIVTSKIRVQSSMCVRYTSLNNVLTQKKFDLHSFTRDKIHIPGDVQKCVDGVVYSNSSAPVKLFYRRFHFRRIAFEKLRVYHGETSTLWMPKTIKVNKN